MTATESDFIREMKDRDAQMAALHAKLTVPPCPDWCTDTMERDEYGSAIDFFPGDAECTFMRFHHTTLSDRVQIIQEERNRSGVVTLLNTHIAVEGEGDEIDADGARVLAGQLVAAADKVDEINGASV
jgi:hypothetical protein